ncbi:unnamed protein product [Oppiella nova]|uniref:Uncharacterized protein n=1 Tax=Oppiella nova TaxID=334625 RepID=A0A7R9MLI5_9ACAR|nr:unnamed protein product [Oppiella nova]CAG2178419.1 unnamed protein product [Oppiella nova]
MMSKTALIILILAMVCVGIQSMPYYFSSDESDNNKLHPLFGPYARNHFNNGDHPRVFIWKHRDHSAAEEARKIIGLMAAQHEFSPGK